MVVLTYETLPSVIFAAYVIASKMNTCTCLHLAVLMAGQIPQNTSVLSLV